MFIEAVFTVWFKSHVYKEVSIFEVKIYNMLMLWQDILQFLLNTSALDAINHSYDYVVKNLTRI